MKMYFQVCATFKFSGGKPSLVCLSLHSTPLYYPYLIRSVSSLLSQSRYFRSLQVANNFITYLLSRYPNSTAPRPVLDALQPFLF
jgi:hypothetical protein